MARNVSGIRSRFGNGVMERGGAPKVMQFMAENWVAGAFKFELMLIETMWLYSIAGTAPPAEWPVNRREGLSEQAGWSFSSSAI